MHPNSAEIQITSGAAPSVNLPIRLRDNSRRQAISQLEPDHNRARNDCLIGPQIWPPDGIVGGGWAGPGSRSAARSIHYS
jgi:hypothetical protein